jgi:hypothetical protein
MEEMQGCLSIVEESKTENSLLSFLRMRVGGIYFQRYWT